MNTARRRKVFAALVLLAVTSGLLFTTSPASGEPQIALPGQNNYWGPGPCPPADASPGESWNCNIANGDIEGAQQIAPTGSRNVFECNGATCEVNQHGVTALDQPDNEASCTNEASDQTATDDQTAEQLCKITQQGLSNDASADLDVEQATPDVNVANTEQNGEQRVQTSQTGNTNELTVDLTISQAATTVVTGTEPLPIKQRQRTLQFSENEMTATASNTAVYTLNRMQNSNAIGIETVEQRQDDTAVDDVGNIQAGDSDYPGGTMGLGQILLDACADPACNGSTTGGTNSVTVNGTDTKLQDATGPLGLTQLQGHPAGGWAFGAEEQPFEVDSAVDGAGFDIDIGAPGSPNGLRKIWSQQGESLSEETKDQVQTDGITILGKKIGSPNDMQSNSDSNIKSDNGAAQVCEEHASGHTKGDGWEGRLHCRLEQNPVVEQTIDFHANNPNVSIRCEQGTGNQTECPVSENEPAVGATLEVSDVDGPWDPDGVTVVQGEEFLYRVTVGNTGDGQSVAENTTVSIPIPNATFVECVDPCPGEPGNDGAVTWNLGDLQGQTEQTRSLRLKVNNDAPIGAHAPNKATGTYGTDGTFESNTTTLNVAVKKLQINFPEQPIKSKKGVFPVDLLVVPEDGKLATVDNPADPVNGVSPATICVGDAPPPGGNPTPGSQPEGVDAACTEAHGTVHPTDLDGDGDVDALRFHFDAPQAGFERGDTTGYVTGRLHDGSFVEGSAPIRTS